MKDMQESPENYRNVKLFAFEPSLSTQPKLQHFEIKTRRLQVCKPKNKCLKTIPSVIAT